MEKTGRKLVALAVTSALLTVAGCSSDNPGLKKLTRGITKDSAIALMGGKADSAQTYLINGKYIEALYYASPGAKDSASQALRKMQPIVLVDSKLVGWAWPFWDSVAAANKVELPPKQP